MKLKKLAYALLLVYPGLVQANAGFSVTVSENEVVHSPKFFENGHSFQSVTILTGGTLDLDNNSTRTTIEELINRGTFNTAIDLEIQNSIYNFNVFNIKSTSTIISIPSENHNAGIMRVDGTFYGMTGGQSLINSGELTGSGAILMDVLAANQTNRTNNIISPGSETTPYGTLQITGSLQLNSSSLIKVRVDPSSQAVSKINITGSAFLAGKVLHIGTNSMTSTDFKDGKSYVFLEASGGFNNTSFEGVSSDFAFLATSLAYTPTTVSLAIQRKQNRFSDFTNTPNQSAVANSIEGLPTSNALHQFVQGLSSSDVAATLNNLSGESHATWQSGLPMLSAPASTLGTSRLNRNLTAGYRPGAMLASAGGDLPKAAWPTSKALPMWAEVIGQRQSIAGDTNTDSMTQNVYGLFLGADEEIGSNGWRVGGSFGFTNANGKVNQQNASSKIDSYSASIYTGKRFRHGQNHINFSGGFAYTHHNIASERIAAGDTLTADYNANTSQIFAELGFSSDRYDKKYFEPFIGINLSQQRVEGFQETGGIAALTAQKTRKINTSTTLGLRGHKDFTLAKTNARMTGTIGWRHAFGTLNPSTTMAFSGSDAFSVTGVPTARNTVIIGLKTELEMSKTAQVEFGLHGEYGNGTKDSTASAKIRWAF